MKTIMRLVFITGYILMGLQCCFSEPKNQVYFSYSLKERIPTFKTDSIFRLFSREGIAADRYIFSHDLLTISYVYQMRQNVYLQFSKILNREDIIHLWLGYDRIFKITNFLKFLVGIKFTAIESDSVYLMTDEKAIKKGIKELSNEFKNSIYSFVKKESWKIVKRAWFSIIYGRIPRLEDIYDSILNSLVQSAKNIKNVAKSIVNYKATFQVIAQKYQNAKDFIVSSKRLTVEYLDYGLGDTKPQKNRALLFSPLAGFSLLLGIFQIKLQAGPDLIWKIALDDADPNVSFFKQSPLIVKSWFNLTGSVSICLLE